MIKNIIFVATLTLSICPQLYSMENVSLESPDQFSIQTVNHHLRFRRINLHNLNEQDRQNLITHFGDFDALQNMFGSGIASAFKTVDFFSSEGLLNIYIQGYDEQFEKMPTEQKFMYHWILENMNNNDFVGHLAIRTYVDERPADYADTLLLEVGGAIAKNYRNKGVLSQLAMPTLQKLATLAPFNNGTFCFGTRADNEDILELAKKQGAELICSHDKEFDFRLFKKSMPCCLFVIPKTITHCL